MRVCKRPGCPTLGDTALCARHRREVETERGTAAERGYGPAHIAMRLQWAPLVATGTVTCWRCGKLIRQSQPWDMGHVDGDPSRYAGPEHQACNRAAPRHRKP